MINNDNDIESILKNEWKIEDSIFVDYYTKTHFFLLPLVIPTHLSQNVNKFYINSFFNDDQRKKQKDTIILIHFRTDTIDNIVYNDWGKLKKVLLELPTYSYHYYVGNDGVYEEIIMAFTIPERFMDSFLKIKNGQYSKTNILYKNYILAYFNKFKEATRLLQAIFFKEEWLRIETENLINTKLHKDVEYFDAFLYDRENFRKQI